MAQNKITIGLLLAPLGVLAVPLVAKQFTNEVGWNSFDFIIMGFILYCAVGLYLLLTINVSDTRHRVIIRLMVMATLFSTWAELAVGIFGTPLARS